MKSVYIIGDVHGKLDKLEALLANVENHHCAENEAELVFVGDYIDRGPDSKGVLELVKSLTEKPGIFSKVVALKGNHEEMMMDVLDGIDDTGLWLPNGGVETIKSFLHFESDVWQDFCSRKQLSILIGASIIKWVRELPLYYEIGKVGISHAGIDNPLLPASEQSRNSLIWSRKLRLERHAVYDYTVHGHTPMKQALVDDHVAYIDTGAVFGGPLTALFIKDVENPDAGKEVLQVD